jgi:hypothetical protein
VFAIALSAVARRLDPACPAGRQAVSQPGSEQDLRRALYAQMLRNVPQSRRRLHDRVSRRTASPPVSAVASRAQLGIDQPGDSSTDDNSHTSHPDLPQSEASADEAFAEKHPPGSRPARPGESRRTRAAGVVGEIACHASWPPDLEQARRICRSVVWPSPIGIAARGVPNQGFCAGLMRVGSAAAGSRTGAVIRAAAYRGH